MSTRKTKALVLSLLKADAEWSEFQALDPASLINGLLAALSRPEEEIRYRAAQVLGRAAAGLVQRSGDGEDPGEGLEQASNIRRRLIWFLNDECGAVGWGAAEAMAEIMVRVPDLASEFSANLVFMLRDDPHCPDFGPLVKAMTDCCVFQYLTSVKATFSGPFHGPPMAAEPCRRSR